jgi:hypothetical protein
MRLSRVELESPPALGLELHPRLTVVAADPGTRARIVAALDALLRGRASDLRGAFVADTAFAEFVVESTSGPALAGTPAIVRPNDIDTTAATGPSAAERAEERYADALEGLRLAEAALAEQHHVVEALRERARTGAPAAVPAAPVVVDVHDAERQECRTRLRAYVDELQAALRDPAIDERARIALLEQGTVLAADASRLGVCRPAAVRALLDAVDALNRVPSFAGPAGAGAGVEPLVREVVSDLDAPTGAGAAPAPSAGADELTHAEERVETFDRAVVAARSRALAVFAELESARRSSGSATGGGTFATALHARLNRPMATSWVGASPVIVDDALVGCPRDDLPASRTVLLDAARRVQVVYVTDDADALAWASQLPADDGALVRAEPRADR